MRNHLVIIATSALCLMLVAAVPVPSSDQEQTKGLEIVQIPLQGNKEIDILSLPENAEGQLSERNKRTIDVLRQLFPELSKMTADGNAANSIDLAAISERLQSSNRVVRNTAAQTKTPAAVDSNTVPPSSAASEEPKAAASEVSASEAQPIDELSLDDENDDENRNKRFLSFGLGGGGGGGSGGSGNFLFDIIRRTADRAARAAGTIYRVAAGTESFELDFNKEAARSTEGDTDTDNDNYDSTSRKLTDGLNDGLVGGSAGTEQTDEKENAPEEGGEAVVGVAKGVDGYTEGIPGPVTRLFVLANRGLANLIQDLILRIAQTSERVVNFKARLITSLI